MPKGRDNTLKPDAGNVAEGKSRNNLHVLSFLKFCTVNSLSGMEILLNNQSKEIATQCPIQHLLNEMLGEKQKSVAVRR